MAFSIIASRYYKSKTAGLSINFESKLKKIAVKKEIGRRTVGIKGFMVKGEKKVSTVLYCCARWNTAAIPRRVRRKCSR